MRKSQKHRELEALEVNNRDDHLHSNDRNEETANLLLLLLHFITGVKPSLPLYSRPPRNRENDRTTFHAIGTVVVVQ